MAEFVSGVQATVAATQRDVMAAPPLLRNRAYLGFLVTQFLGAFNDNVFKQAVLLLAVEALRTNPGGPNFQFLVTLAFTLPFVVFSAFAGELADRFCKATIIQLCKLAEVVVMGAGIAVFAYGHSEAALWLLVALAFLMGLHSSFFGPPKYSCIPELVRRPDLSLATGLTQLTTMIAIILGVAVAGILVNSLGEQRWVIGVVCCGIAITGSFSALLITRVPAADPGRMISARSFVRGLEFLIHIARRDTLLLLVIVANSYFWFLGALALPLVNEYGKLQLGFDDAQTSYLVAILSLGIGVGSAVAGQLTRGTTVRLAAAVPGYVLLVGAFVAVAALPVPAPQLGATVVVTTVDTATGIVAYVLMFVMGASAGMYSLPLLTFIQLRPADADRGRVLGVWAFMNWVFILLAAFAYGVAAELTAHHANAVFAWMAAVSAVLGAAVLPLIVRRAASEAKPTAAALSVNVP